MTTQWRKRADSPKRLTGRHLQRRNARIKLRDLYTCQECGRVTDELEIDHIVPLSRQGTDDDSNVRSLCTDCHRRKSESERTGKPAVIRGCDVHGFPLDPKKGW